MDFNSPFILQCLLVIITVTDGSVTTIGALSGSSAIFPIGLENLQNLSKMSKDNERCFVNMVNGTWLVSCGSCYRRLNLQNGSLVLRSVEKEDEGNYEFVFNDITKSFALEVLEPAIAIQCFPDGTVELFEWLLNGSKLKTSEACIKDGGKKFVCEVHHKNGITRCGPIVLSCSYGDLLQYPLFIYILAGCAGGAAILVVVVSSVICCCMKRKHKFIPVPSEDEKDDGIAMSVVSSEAVKSPPNGDHVEAQAAQIDCPPVPGYAAQIGPGIEPLPLVEENLPVVVEPEEMPEQEMIGYVESQEHASDCFPDPTDD
uniref:Ig-like domain-containing protein n=1 Tax=Anas platyrhynchos TaxID=8839 RepID=A0A8B9TLS4_ANAPL